MGNYITGYVYDIINFYLLTLKISLCLKIHFMTNFEIFDLRHGSLSL